MVGLALIGAEDLRRQALYSFPAMAAIGGDDG